MRKGVEEEWKAARPRQAAGWETLRMASTMGGRVEEASVDVEAPFWVRSSSSAATRAPMADRVDVAADRSERRRETSRADILTVKIGVAVAMTAVVASWLPPTSRVR